MSVLLYVLGIVSAVAGVAAIFFGIPVKEFSFGDTLIASGATAAVGGLILIGLGAAVGQLQRIAEFLGARPLARAGQVEPAVRIGNGPGRIPFPPKPKTDPRSRAAEMPVAPRARPKEPAGEPPLGAAPSLPNPDVPLMAEDEAEQLPLSPREAAVPSSRETPAQDQELPNFAGEPPPPPPPSRPRYFDKMWPDQDRNPPPAEQPVPSRPESIARVSDMDEAEPVAEEPREEDVVPVAVLKSGVVDGMGYTLYVDGSIEAELPDGTLRFASINELRAHLEKNS
jgi:hypothetical protein